MEDENKNKYLAFFPSFKVAIDLIEDPAEQLQAYKAITDYGIYHKEPERPEQLPGIVRAIYEMAKPTIDGTRAKADTARNNGNKSPGAPKGNQNRKKKTSEASEREKFSPSIE